MSGEYPTPQQPTQQGYGEQMAGYGQPHALEPLATRARTLLILAGWWVCWVASGLVSSISSAIDPDGTNTAGMVATVISTVLFVGAYALLVPMVRTLTREQDSAIAQRQQPAWS